MMIGEISSIGRSGFLTFQWQSVRSFRDSDWNAAGTAVMVLNSLRAIFLGEAEVPAEHRDAVGAARRKAFHALAPMAAIHSLLNAVVLTVVFWNEPAMPLVFVWTYTSAVLVFIRVHESTKSSLS